MNESNSNGKSCPRCRLINPSTAKICDCGYNFETGRKERARKDKKTKGTSLFKRVLAILGVCVAVLVVVLGILMKVRGSVYGNHPPVARDRSAI